MICDIENLLICRNSARLYIAYKTPVFALVANVEVPYGSATAMNYIKKLSMG